MKNRTYRYFDGQPLYPFGFGLSYSKFAYSNVTLSTPTLKAGDSLLVDADVKNASDREGDEVVELYLSFPKVPGAPIHALRGMKRVHLKGGETQDVHFALDARDLSASNENGDRVVITRVADPITFGQFQLSLAVMARRPSPTQVRQQDKTCRTRLLRTIRVDCCL